MSLGENGAEAAVRKQGRGVQVNAHAVVAGAEIWVGEDVEVSLRAAADGPGTAASVCVCAPGTSAAISSPTAMNDNQKPGCCKAQGSAAITAVPATAHTAAAGQRQPSARTRVTTASMPTVRCAGTPQPASSA